MKKRTRREKRMYEEKNEKKIEKRQIQFYDILIQCSGKILKSYLTSKNILIYYTESGTNHEF